MPGPCVGEAPEPGAVFAADGRGFGTDDRIAHFYRFRSVDLKTKKDWPWSDQDRTGYNCKTDKKLLYGEEGWASKLAEAKLYENKRKADSRIFATSALFHMFMPTVLHMTVDELYDNTHPQAKLITDFEACIQNLLEVRRYNLENMAADENSVNKAREYFGIDLLKKRIEIDLIQAQRKENVDKLRLSYDRCKQEVTECLNTAISNKELMIAGTEGTVQEIQSRLKEIQRQKDHLIEEKRNLECTLQALHKFDNFQCGALEEGDGQ